jgi:peptide/nickel transport system permease protein
MGKDVTWSEWLTTEAPETRLQGRVARSYWNMRRFAANPLALCGFIVVVGLVVVALFAPVIAPADPLATNLGARLRPPSAEYFFGTDQLGRDIYSRVIYGSRVTLAIVVLVAILIGPIGMAVGVISGYFSGTVDRFLMGLTDIVMAFPRLILALAFVAVLGPGLENAVIAIAITGWPPYARLARAEALSLRNREFVLAARLQGASRTRVLLRYIAPLCLPSVVIRLTLDMAGIILIAAGLGFLGLGAQPPLAEWGAMVAGGRDYIVDQWWVATLPGAAIFVVSLAFNLLGDGLRDVFDPRV